MTLPIMGAGRVPLEFESIGMATHRYCSDLGLL